MDDLRPITEGTHSSPLIIAGPCSAETCGQVLSTAGELAAEGIGIFRAGVWKPRTMPGGFEGVGAPALRWLREVRETTGMMVATEVATRGHVLQALKAGIDILWIGARTSANPFAIQEIADTLHEAGADIPVLVKNPVSPDIELWIGAIQRLYNAGIRRLGAIHRGFPAYGEHIYRNPPQWSIPTELRLRLPRLPIISDPSHIGGKRELIRPIAQHALNMGFDGLIIESHCNPDAAWSDASQQITPGTLKTILDSLVVPESQSATEQISLFRSEIDSIDNELLDALARRMEISRQIGLYKKQHSIPVVQPERYNNVIRTRINAGERLKIDPTFLRTLLLAIHDESVRQQMQIIREGEQPCSTTML